MQTLCASNTEKKILYYRPCFVYIPPRNCKESHLQNNYCGFLVFFFLVKYNVDILFSLI